MFDDSDYSVRVKKEADYIISTGATVRATAKYIGTSKSTVHKDMTERLRYISPELCDKVRQVLEKNRNERHLRGGEATKNKYLEIKLGMRSCKTKK